MLLSRLGLVELTQPDITLSGLNPFELRQSGEAQISKRTCVRTHRQTHTNGLKKRKKCMQLGIGGMTVVDALQHLC